MRNFSQNVLIIAVVLLSAYSSFAQPSSGLEIILTNQNADAIFEGELRCLDSESNVLAREGLTGKKVLSFSKLPPGVITIEINSPGFEPFAKSFTLNPGENHLEIELEVKRIEEKVDIEQNEIDKRLEQAFSHIYTQEEIDSLPDDPQELEKELKRRYGDDLVIRINGFTGGTIPPKAMIRSIQVNKSSFDAEFHELGVSNVNITTKSMVPKTFGTVMFNYGNSALNARNAFAREKLPQQNIMFMGMLMGPLTKRSSYMATLSRLSNTSEVNVYSNSGSGFTSNDLTRTMKSFLFSGGINYDLGENHTFRFDFSNSRSENDNLGIGGLSLPSRGFGMKSGSNNFTFSNSGTIAKKYNQEFRSQMRWNDSENMSNSTSPGISIGGAYNGGGAGIDNSSKTKHFEAFEKISFAKGNHLIKLGGEMNYDWKSVLSSDGTNGRFYFRNISDYQNRKPATYSQTVGTSDYSFSRIDFAAFAQDDFRVAKRLQIGLGLRYEIQSGLKDYNNFSPRLSATYVLDKKAKFVVRSGVGILYDWYDDDKIERILSNDGDQTKQTLITNPGYPDPNNGGIAADPLPPSVYRQADDLRNPYVFITQTAFDAKIKSGTSFGASYKFERGIRMFRSRDLNSPLNGVRPDPSKGRINYLESSGLTTRNSLELTGETVFFKRVKANARYELAKTIDDFDGAFSLPSDSYNLRADRGASDNDRRHRFTTRFDYSPFPFLTIFPSVTINSPMPYTITTGYDNNGDTVYNDRPIGIVRNSARGSWSKTVNLSTSWTIPIVKKPAQKVNGKEIGSNDNLPWFMKYHNLLLTVSVNNLFNSVNRDGYIGNQLSPLFGQATYSQPARSVNFSLMFLYF